MAIVSPDGKHGIYTGAFTFTYKNGNSHKDLVELLAPSYLLLILLPVKYLTA